MAVIPLADGTQVLWEPTTELLCMGCRKAIDVAGDPQEAMAWTNFMFDLLHPEETSLAIGQYWYLHKRCMGIEDALMARGAKIGWGWYGMDSVLGLDTVMWKQTFGNVQKMLQKCMPPGIYDCLHEHWRPAIKVLPTKRMRHRAVPKIALPKASTPAKIVKPVRLPRQARTPSWNTLRFTIMQRDGFRCLLCGISAKDDPDVILEVDHIIPRSRGGTNDPDNLWTLCYPCNRGKGAQLL